MRRCVAVPTVKHHEVAAALLDAGLDLLVEKPLAANLAEADDLIARAERGRRIVQPGHLERFNPAVLAVEPNLKRPMFFEAHRLSVFTPRSLDVDVVLDLMIHDLDIVLTFAKVAGARGARGGAADSVAQGGHCECARGVRSRAAWRTLRRRACRRSG